MVAAGALLLLQLLLATRALSTLLVAAGALCALLLVATSAMCILAVFQCLVYQEERYNFTNNFLKITFLLCVPCWQPPVPCWQPPVPCCW